MRKWTDRQGMRAKVVIPAGILLVWVLTVFPSITQAQVVRGRLLDSESERPVINGTVTLIDSLEVAVARTLSDSAGGFELAGPHPGPFSIKAKGVGYQGFPVPVTLVEGSEVTADVYLRPNPLLLEPLLVSAERVRSELERQGFFRRREEGHGFFLTPSHLKARPPITEAEVIGRVPFVEIDRSWNGSRVLMRRRGSTCDPAILIDNSLIKKGENIEDHVNSADIVAVEVFRGIAEIPPELALGLESCGAVMIWTIWSERRSRKAGGGGM